MPSVKNIKLTIGGPETTPGTPEARAAVIPVRGLAGLDKTAERAPDPAVLGSNMDQGEYLMADSIEGGIPLAIRPCIGMGLVFKSLLGKHVSEEVGACIQIRYKGTSASCKLVGDTTGNTLKSYVGTKGSEILDSNFGTSGSIDLTAVGTDTVGELVSEINGYADYDCQKLLGEDAVNAGDIIDITVQAAGMWAYIWFSSTTTGVYRYRYTPELGNVECPTVTIQKDGYQDNFLYAGCVVDSLSLSAALKSFVEAECSLFGFSEAPGQTASTLDLKDIDPLIFYKGSFSLGAKDYTYIRNHSLNIANNHASDAGYGIGTVSRQFHQKGQFDVTGEVQLRLNSDSYAERAKVFDDTLVALSYHYKGKSIATDITELILIEIPYCNLREPAWPENSGQIDIKYGYKAIKPKGTPYNEPLAITMLRYVGGA